MLSSIGVPMKMMLSLSSREKMSYARSPRLVCSTTIGTSWARMSGRRVGLSMSHAGLFDEPRHGLFTAHAGTNPIHRAILFQPGANGRGRAAGPAGKLLDFLLHILV